ncbi:hypothetical protein SLEP1_g22779 [Rubroshorea leprosula]|uniref:Uncharacterized protein n=1 Tax=Rubroshorea leprosula TaxID=152421 RepID=A0AAV5JMA0_9ROSI|nr:hypothetical protein SLEP1_g22779 [Rubroshorea leprosula]
MGAVNASTCRHVFLWNRFTLPMGLNTGTITDACQWECVKHWHYY